ncbi:Hypothetical_protein [Hexamita inflata]|uniref:Hypothetical_protein n=1 Tax=Hexamita inflata TaxID=28002 RepID=A0AA86NNM8_9EUKA|nr:Hypothetical protein HINF_LOCUS11337 [Hexamita inflata]
MLISTKYVTCLQRLFQKRLKSLTYVRNETLGGSKRIVSSKYNKMTHLTVTLSSVLRPNSIYIYIYSASVQEGPQTTAKRMTPPHYHPTVTIQLSVSNIIYYFSCSCSKSSIVDGYSESARSSVALGFTFFLAPTPSRPDGELLPVA